MKQNTGRKLLGVLLALVLVLGLVPGMSLTAKAAMAQTTTSDSETPLTLEAITDEATVKVSNPKSGMKYSIDGGKTKKAVANNSPITLKKGDTVSFYGNGTNIKWYYSSSQEVGTEIHVSSGKSSIYGNIMSLVDENGFADNTKIPYQNTFCYLFQENDALYNHDTRELVLPATTLKSNCYRGLFWNCSSLTKAPDLPATTLAKSCYEGMFCGTSLTEAPVLPATTLATYCYQEMFYQCKSLTKAPDLPATTLATYCYQAMFSGCSSLAEAPDLPATTLTSYCYGEMFYGCSSLTEAPFLPATTLASNCYNMMFDECSSLRSVTCLATDISASNATNKWLSSVASTGTFTKAAGMNTWLTQSSGIPTGWTVTNYAEKNPEKVTLDPSTATLDVDATVALKATVSPKNTTDKTVKWSVNNSNVKLYTNHACTTEVGTDATTILTVYAKGMSAGNATVTAISNADNTKNAVCTVTVKAGHIHSFNYTVSGATITATCTANGCKLTNNQATLTLKVPATDGGAAVLEADPESAFGDLSGSVKYQTKSGSTWGAETATVPTTAGIHRASLTLIGADSKAVTASVAYGNKCITYATGLTNGTVSGAVSATCGATVTPTITPAAGYQLDTLTVTPEEGSGVSSVTVNGGTFVMPEANVTVSATFKEITYDVTVDGAKATVKDSLPEQNTYTAELTGLPDDKTYDGAPVNLTASVQKSDGFPDNKVTVGTVSFKDKNNNTVTTAKNVGDYTASVTVGDKTISKAFKINGRTPSITYVESTERVGNNIVISLVTTDQYLPLENNPNGITLLKDGETYVASGNIAIGALVYTGEVNLILCKNTTVTIYAGIYHIGSKLNLYIEEGGDNSELIVKGNKALSELTNDTGHDKSEMKDAGSSLSGTIQVNGGKLTVEKGNSKLVSDDISLTLGAGLGAKVTTSNSEIVNLSGGTEHNDGSVTYGKDAFANISSLAVKPVATVKTEPAANTLTYTGEAQELVTAGEAEGGTMQYALGTATEATEPYTTSIPAKTDAGTYYVWYKAVGDQNHTNSEPKCIKVEIKAVPKASPSPTPAPKPTSEPTPKPTPAPAPEKKVSGTLLAKMTAKGKTNLVLSWNKVKGVQGYDVFFVNCSKKKPKLTASVKGKNKVKRTFRKLKKNTPYKAYVKAWIRKNGKKTYVRTSPVVHAYTTGGTKHYTNVRSVTVNKKKIILKAGRSCIIKANLNKLYKGRKLMPRIHTAALRYVSTSPGVAKVTKRGRIKGLKKGKCYVYVIAHNGASQKTTVLVK